MPTNKPEVILVDDIGLKRLNGSQGLAKYCRRLIDNRDFIRARAKTQAFRGGRGTYLGWLWTLLDPVFQIAVYAIVFGLILEISRGMDNYLGFLTIGVIFFGFFRSAVSEGNNLIYKSRNLISSFRFPVASLVFSNTIRRMLDGIPPALICILATLAFQASQPPSWTVVLVIPIYLLLQLFCTGVIFFVSRSAYIVPDLKSVFNLLVRGLFFISGVFFTIDRFETHLILRLLVEYNPVYQFLMAVRACVMEGVSPAADTWLYLSAWSVAIFITGFLFFWRGEKSYASI